MNETYIIYDPAAGEGKCREEAEILDVVYRNTIIIDMNKISSYHRMFSGMDDSDTVILCGGDETLNRFVNSIHGIHVKVPLFFYSVGNRNDFVRDLGRDRGSTPDFPVNEYLYELPTVTLKGDRKQFINGIGYGMGISMFGLLFRYEPIEIELIIDGKSHCYKEVWMVCTTKGRYLEGAAVTPKQCRSDKNKRVSVLVIHNVSRLKAMWLFWLMRKGHALKCQNGVEFLSGSIIYTAFERPVFLQVDGNEFYDVHDYWVSS